MKNPQYWCKGGYKWAQIKKNLTETCVLKPIMVGEINYFFMIWGHFSDERVIFDFFTSNIDDFIVKTRIYR